MSDELSHSNKNVLNPSKRDALSLSKREWKECNLGDVVELITKGTTPTTIGSQFVEKGINYVKSEAISYDGRIDKSTFVYINEETHEKLKRSQLLENDILYSMAGVFLGKNALVPKDILPANTNQALAIIRLDKKVVIPKFVHYYLRQKNVIELANNISGQSAQPNINFEEIKSIDLLLPPLPEQKAIARVLCSLDDKIDLLHRQNKTLEAMAETLFRQYFIENANEGWEEKALDEIANYLNGLACQKYTPENDFEKLPVLKIKELRSGVSDSSDWATSNVPNEYIIENGDVIFSWSGSLLVKIWDGENCVLNQHLFKVTSTDYPKWFFYLWTKFHLENFIAIAESKSTTMGHIKREDLKNSMVLVPNSESLDKMNQVIEPIIDRLINNSNSIKTLEKLRDTLLPKLMSGEVRVRM